MRGVPVQLDILSLILKGQSLFYPPPAQAKLKSFSAKIVQLLKEWTEAFPYDFQDEKAMAELKAITHRVTQCDEVRSSLDPAELLVWGGVGLQGQLCMWSPSLSLSPEDSSWSLPLPHGDTSAGQQQARRALSIL